MICPDINLLLYATFSTYPQHASARDWWDGVLSGTRPVRIAHVVVLGYLRMATSKRVFNRPLSTKRAIAVIDSWLDQPNVELIAPGESHWEHLKSLLLASHASGNLTTDAHIAALALDYGLVVHSNDTDFARFPDVKCVNPL